MLKKVYFLCPECLRCVNRRQPKLFACYKEIVAAIFQSVNVTVLT